MNLYAIAAGTYASTKVDTTTVEPLSSVRWTGHISAISSSRFRSAGLRSPVTAILKAKLPLTLIPTLILCFGFSIYGRF